MDKKVAILTTILAILIISQLNINIATAALPDEAGAYMVQKGLDSFVYGIGDSMISLANGGNTSINRTETTNEIMKILTYSIDPYRFEFVQEWQNTMLVFYVFILILILIIGSAIFYQSGKNPELIKKIYYITKNPKLVTFNTYRSLISSGIVLLIFGIFGIFYILKLEYITNALIVNHALATAPPLMDNMIAYFFMALSYLILSIVMGVRSIIILTFVSGEFGLFALYLLGLLVSHTTESVINFVISLFIYFMVIIFMQPLILFVSAIGLAFIGVLPPQLISIQILIVIGLFLILSVISISCIFAAGIIKNIVYTRGF